jgi:hypothetical protein
MQTVMRNRPCIWRVGVRDSRRRRRGRRQVGGGSCEMNIKSPQYVGLVAPDEKGVEWVYVGKMFAPSPIYGMTSEEIMSGYRPIQVRRPGLPPLKLGSDECGFAIVHPSRLVQLSTASFSDADIGRGVSPLSLSTPFCTSPGIAKGVSMDDVKLTLGKQSKQPLGSQYSKPLLVVRQPCTLSQFAFTS